MLEIERLFREQPARKAYPSRMVEDAFACAARPGLESVARQTVLNAGALKVGPFGKSVTFGSAEYFDIAFPHRPNAYTLIAIGYFQHAGGQRHILDDDVYSGNRGFQLRLNNFALEFIPFDNSGNPATVFVPTDNYVLVDSPRPRVIVARAGGGFAKLDGTDIPSYSVGMASTAALNGVMRVGNSRGSATVGCSDGLLAYVCVPRVLTDGEVRAVINNPWQLFRADPLRIYSLPSGPITLGTPRFLRVTSSGFGVELDLS